MDLPKLKNPFDCLSGEDRENIEALERCDDLNFVKAVDILSLDPSNDFRYADLSGIRFDGLNLNLFDFYGSNITNSSFVDANTNDGLQLSIIEEFVCLLDERVEWATSSAFSDTRAAERSAVNRTSRDFSKISNAAKLALDVFGAKRPFSLNLESFKSHSLIPFVEDYFDVAGENYSDIVDMQLVSGGSSLFSFGVAPVSEVQFRFSRGSRGRSEVLETILRLCAKQAQLRKILVEAETG